MAFLLEYASFLLKTVTLVIAIIAVLIFIVSLKSRKHEAQKGQLQIQKINEHFDKLHDQLEEAIFEKDVLKKLKKEKTKQQKADKGKQPTTKSRVFVLDFIGDIKASAVENLRQEITAILTIATPADEVVVRLESPGGMVHSYGLAASQLSRIREANIPLTICVDKVAASGGYMMACIGNRIYSAPFAILGSIGVVAQIPNAHKLLKKHDIDYEVMTAGEYKRTMTIFGENTAKGREKFQEDLEITHQLFKSFVAANRPHLNIDEIATGETWLGTAALEKHLVDSIVTSDQYLMDKAKQADIYCVHYVIKRGLQEKIGFGAAATVDHVLTKGLDHLNQLRFWR
ncbi:protease SohB [Entomomonas asaccharolytica]|uniref:Protease SohB n=1 Tax=Entomomonas asaccharolytica TaxID=2785331 RepID=A0A974NHD7_9GAMM|nr:protease SohB [Entomomonas asaccharolytica]QQP86592.1 protease SohB [Entomomonas asaccharolytica]